MVDRQFYLDQLKEHLQYYREIGVDTLHAELGERIVALARQSFRGSKSSPDRELESGLTEPNKVLPLFPATVRDSVSGESLDDIRTDLGDCRRCALCAGRTHIVFGSGTSETQLVFVGEGPGADEDAQGLPFVGAAGQLLTKIIEAIQLKREQVYICNVVKCRPPGNRTPEEEEIRACSPFLFRQIASIQPKVICCLGAVATQTILKTKTPVGKLRGRFHEFQGIQVMPTWHPAYLLRNPAAKRDVWNDVRLVKSALDSSS